MSNKSVKPKVGNILFNILAIITVISVGFIGFNIAFGAKGYAVTGESMAETLHRGDLVFSKKADFDSLRVGDVVTVGSKERDEYFTHRIVEIDRENKTITTKGDNNTENDPMATSADRVVGVMWYSVPLLGYLSIALGGISGIKGLIILAIIAVVMMALNMILSKKSTKKDGGGNDE